ncbi:isochorismatase [Candidatus Villigracilis affinis]|uniref:isochorismatase n=1 Tax=Candidatus Villigracilis affinis TaxID=3140682 RepID=UPI002A18F94D|nr:isochorismatase [Anaerolineales bacterium]
MSKQTLPLPDFFESARVGQIWKVDYASRAEQARQYALQHDLKPASVSNDRISLLVIDAQNTFCMPDFELFVGGRSGHGAVDDTTRLCEFIYRNLGSITHIIATMDTHMAQQIFHPIFFVDAKGNHPAPYSDIHLIDLTSGRWKFNAALAPRFNIAPEYGQQMMIHYAESLEKKGKYALTIWPYHAMLGGIGHALVPALEEAIFFHSIARLDQPSFEIKGDKPFTEHYSVIGPEVLTGPMGEDLGSHDTKFIQHLQEVDRLYIAGQAKSHCVAWTVSDLLDDINATDPNLAKKVYLLEDCSSPVVVPGVVDHTEAANEAYIRFAKAGMKVVKSTDGISPI